jgi:5-methylthioribose kinase
VSEPGFLLDRRSVVAHLRKRGVLGAGEQPHVTELAGGVSGVVLLVESPGRRLVVKQALAQLRVEDEWLAPLERTDAEAAALRLAARLTPDAVPPVVDHDGGCHVLVLAAAPARWVNWQQELERGHAHAGRGAWAGDVLGRWHAATAGDAGLIASFERLEAFEALRLDPYHRTVMARRPELAPFVAPYLEALATTRRCLVHGDFAPKNILLGVDGAWVLDHEVAHHGNPLFDLSFMLSFLVLDTLHRPELGPDLRAAADGFLTAYARAAGPALAPDPIATSGHTACQLLARVDGKSTAAFLTAPAVAAARSLGTALLLEPAGSLAELWERLGAVLEPA